MNHCGTCNIETKRLLLRRFEIEDAAAMYHNQASDPEVTKYLTWPAYTSVDDAQTILQEWIQSYQNPAFYQWAIVPKDLNAPIGSISVVDLDEKTETMEIGYCIGRKWWHQGITAEALKAVIDFLFAQVKANRTQARHDVNNQGLCDVSYYAVLRSDR